MDKKKTSKIIIQQFTTPVRVVVNGNKNSIIDPLDTSENKDGILEERELTHDNNFEAEFTKLTREVAEFNKSKRRIVSTFPKGDYLLTQRRLVKPKEDEDSFSVY